MLSAVAWNCECLHADFRFEGRMTVRDEPRKCCVGRASCRNKLVNEWRVMSDPGLKPELNRLLTSWSPFEDTGQSIFEVSGGLLRGLMGVGSSGNEVFQKHCPGLRGTWIHKTQKVVFVQNHQSCWCYWQLRCSQEALTWFWGSFPYPQCNGPGIGDRAWQAGMKSQCSSI